MSAKDEVKISIGGILGIASPFYQGGSLRLTIPKRVVTKYRLEEKVGKEFFSLIFIEADKGIFMIPLDKVVRPDNIREALKFVDLSSLTDEDLKALFEED